MFLNRDRIKVRQNCCVSKNGFYLILVRDEYQKNMRAYKRNSLIRTNAEEKKDHELCLDVRAYSA